MIKLEMSKGVFHNSRSIHSVSSSKTSSSVIPKDKKINVDINKLLNRVKINQKNETKSKLIYFGSGIFLLSFLGFFLVILN